MKKILKAHKVFVRETPSYIKGTSLRHKMYYPIAYIRFMYFSIKN